MYVDLHARRRNVAPEFKLETFYGQLQHIYVVHFDSPHPELNLHDTSTTLILAQIKSCKVNRNESIPGLDIHFYSAMGNTDVIDITSVQCVVGRVPCGNNRWAIIDRSGALARAIAEIQENDSDDDDDDEE
jgi:hypothetical protein